MNLLIQVVCLLASVVIFLTVLAQLSDHERMPVGSGWMDAVRHHLSKLASVGIAGGAIAVALIVLTDRVPAVPLIAFVCGTAMRQLTHPDSWWEFAIRGRPYVPCGGRRQGAGT